MVWLFTRVVYYILLSCFPNSTSALQLCTGLLASITLQPNQEKCPVRKPPRACSPLWPRSFSLVSAVCPLCQPYERTHRGLYAQPSFGMWSALSSAEFLAPLLKWDETGKSAGSNINKDAASKLLPIVRPSYFFIRATRQLNGWHMILSLE